jgi:hypothetical protein
MSDNQQQQQQQQDDSDVKYFKSDIATLDVVIGDPDPTKGEVAPQTVQFEPYWDIHKNSDGSEYRKKIGYLKTDNGSALRKLADSSAVIEITKKEYDAATVEKKDASGVQISGFRAPN